MLVPAANATVPVQYIMERKAWDRIVSAAGAVLAVALIVLGAAAIYGGTFGHSNVRDRLEPQNVFFPPADAMTSEESAEVGDFAGEQVDTGDEAEAYSRFIGLHLGEINGGKTYSDTSAEARAEGIDPEVAAELQSKADTLFKGETLRAILLNSYGWWTVATIALYAGLRHGLGGDHPRCACRPRIQARSASGPAEVSVELGVRSPPCAGSPTPRDRRSTPGAPRSTC